MYVLHYYPDNASLLPHIMLREIGAPFELRLVDRDRGEHRGAAYRKLNPNGLIPALEDDGCVLFETAAIALHLCDRHPQAGLAPPAGTAERAQFYKWMVHLGTTPQAEYRSFFYPERYTQDPAAVAGVKQLAGARMVANFARIAEQLGERPWLLESGFSAADLYLAMLVRWGGELPQPGRPRDVPALRAHAERAFARPAALAAFAAEGIAPPLL